MAIEWPDWLVVEIARRRCVLVLGAGVSASAVSADGTKRPPAWEEFLRSASGLAPGQSDRDEIARLLDEGRYLDAAQVLVHCVAEADFVSYVRRILDEPNFQPSEVHRLVQRLDAGVVITPNYDTIFERQCQGGAGGAAAYSVVKYYEPNLINAMRSDQRVIAKAHGCVSDPQRIVLSRGQYFGAKRDHPRFYALVQALCLSSTLLFLGSGLEDPDFQLVLEDVAIAAPEAFPHFALVPAGRHEALVKTMRETWNLELLQYDTGQHQQVIEALRDLVDRVESVRYSAAYESGGV